MDEVLKNIKPVNIDWSAPDQSHADRIEYQRQYQLAYQRKRNAELTRYRQINKMRELINKYPDEAAAALRAR